MIVFNLHASITDGGFMDGLSHPISGLDHLLAMLSVGIVSNMLSKRHLYFLPLAFVSSMILGGILGFSQIPVYFTEIAICLSVFTLSIMIFIAKKNTPPLLIYIFTSVFGIAHGYAHGIETPYTSHAVNYISGFAMTTSFVHILGIYISTMTEKIMGGKLIKGYALLTAIIGVYLFVMQLMVG